MQSVEITPSPALPKTSKASSPSVFFHCFAPPRTVWPLSVDLVDEVVEVASIGFWPRKHGDELVGACAVAVLVEHRENACGCERKRADKGGWTKDGGRWTGKSDTGGAAVLRAHVTASTSDETATNGGRTPADGKPGQRDARR